MEQWFLMAHVGMEAGQLVDQWVIAVVQWDTAVDQWVIAVVQWDTVLASEAQQLPSGVLGS